MDIVLEFTAAEEALVRQYAEEKGMDVSDFIVKTVLEHILNTVLEHIAEEEKAELRGLLDEGLRFAEAGNGRCADEVFAEIDKKLGLDKG